MIHILTFNSHIEEERFTQLLEDESIDFFVKPFHDSAYDGVFVIQKGYSQLYSDEKNREKILELFENFKD